MVRHMNVQVKPCNTLTMSVTPECWCNTCHLSWLWTFRQACGQH